MIEMPGSIMNQAASFKQTAASLAGCEPETARFLVTYLHFLHDTEQLLADSLIAAARRHACTVDAHDLCLYLARYSQSNAASLAPFIQQYTLAVPGKIPAEGVRSVLLDGSHVKELALLMDLQDVALLVNQAKLGWTVLHQVALTLKDQDLLPAATLGLSQTKQQLHWLENYIKLVVLQNAMVSLQTPVP